VGTMNVFAREIGLPTRDLSACWEIVQAGNIRQIDLAKANARCFIQLAGVGLDAQVVRSTNLNFRKRFGPLSYVVTMAQIASRTPPKLEISTPDGIERTGSFVLIGNGRYYGGPVSVFRDARMDDGLLDVLVFRDLGYLDIIRYVRSAIFGTLDKLSDVTYFQTASLRVRSEQEVPVELDGEVDFDLPVDFSIAPAQLSVCVPRKQFSSDLKPIQAGGDFRKPDNQQNGHKSMEP
jgi:diacylglycerol kinase (ATP)